MKYKLHSFFDDPPQPHRPCHQEGCPQHAEYRAPQDRRHLNTYYWFCLEHVRDYNEHWNYYRNMSIDDFEQEQRFDETWQRPTWRFGANAAASIKDPYSVFAENDEKTNSKIVPAYFAAHTEGGKALKLIKLPYPYTRKELKIKYIELAKKYHPDANGGSRAAEEHLKAVNHAYEILKKYLGL